MGDGHSSGRSRPRHYRVALLLLLAGCTEASSPALDLGARLDRLSDAAARALCQEEQLRIDACLVGAQRRWTGSEECEADVRACRAAERLSEVEVCAEQTGPLDACALTVGDYLGCLDAWSALQDCSRAGSTPPTPAACEALVAQCPRFDGAFFPAFFSPGTPPGCRPAESTPRDDGDDDVFGHDGCRPPPDHFVVLGDSIAACSATPETCAPTLIHAYLEERTGRTVELHEHAQPGTGTAALVEQARQVDWGSGRHLGHHYVWVYAIGNDLGDAPRPDLWLDRYEALYAYFSDASTFPDGATFLVNTQYNPCDECAVRPGDFCWDESLNGALRGINEVVFLDVAEARDDTVAIDQLPDFLGHGKNADVSGCHCSDDNASWLADSVHPNGLGQRHIFDKWRVALDGMLGGECGP